MCGRYTLRLKAEEMADQMGLPFVDGDQWEASYNIAPSQMVPVVVKDPYRQIRLMQWGLIPHWMKPRDGAKTVQAFINARSETAAQKPAFRDAFKRQRCLVLADGFYEWRKQTSSTKQPYFFARQDQGLMMLAGLWSSWTSPEGEEIQSCAILTCEPNAMVAQIHHRMPVILQGTDRLAWLDKLTVEQLIPMLKTYPAEKMVSYAVSRAVNSPKFNDPQCVERLEQGRLF